MALQKHQKLKDENADLSSDFKLGIGGLESLADGFMVKSTKSKTIFPTEEDYYQMQEM